MAFEFSLAELANRSKKGRQGLSRGVVVENDVVAFPRPRVDPRSDAHFFAQPAIE